MSDRPLLLLDVDGVLNPLRKPTERPEGYETFYYLDDSYGRLATPDERREAKGEQRQQSLRLWLNPDHGRLLLDVAERTGAELVWATTWGDRANTMIGPRIGLPTLPVVPFSEETLMWPYGWAPDGPWKWQGVAEYAAGRALAWLDDDFDWRSDHFSMNRTSFLEKRGDLPTLLLDVPSVNGLTFSLLKSVDAWLGQLRPVAIEAFYRSIDSYLAEEGTGFDVEKGLARLKAHIERENDEFTA